MFSYVLQCFCLSWHTRASYGHVYDCKYTIYSTRWCYGVSGLLSWVQDLRNSTKWLFDMFFFLERTANNICSRVPIAMRVVQTESEWFITIYHVFWFFQDTRMLSIPGQGNLFMIYHYFIEFFLDLSWFNSFFRICLFLFAPAYRFQ